MSPYRIAVTRIAACRTDDDFDRLEKHLERIYQRDAITEKQLIRLDDKIMDAKIKLENDNEKPQTPKPSG